MTSLLGRQFFRTGSVRLVFAIRVCCFGFLFSTVFRSIALHTLGVQVAAVWNVLQKPKFEGPGGS